MARNAMDPAGSDARRYGHRFDSPFPLVVWRVSFSGCHRSSLKATKRSEISLQYCRNGSEFQDNVYIYIYICFLSSFF